MRCAWWLVVLAGCRQIFGLDDPTAGGVADGRLGDGPPGQHDGAPGDGAGGDGAQPDAALAYYVQGNSTAVLGGQSIAAAFPAGQNAGDLDLVAVTWTSSTTIAAIADTGGANYLRLGPSITSSGRTQAIYLATSIAGGGNAVTVSFADTAGLATLRIAEYRGVTGFDHSATVIGNGTNLTAQVTTEHAHDVVVAIDAAGGQTFTPDSTYTQRLAEAANALQDREVSSVATYTCESKQDTASDWIFTLVAFAVTP